MTEFVTELATFCNEIVEFINIDDTEQDETIAKLSQISSCSNTSNATTTQDNIVFKKSVVLIGTPGSFSSLLTAKKFSSSTSFKVTYHSVILDKVDLI